MFASMTIRPITAVLAATAWISANEFLRNQVVLADHWTGHYATMGLAFPAQPINGAIWAIWSLAFAGIIFILAKRFSLPETATLAWSIGFVLMWLVIGNLGVLPFDILPYAIPWSMVEAFGAAWLVKKVGG